MHVAQGRDPQLSLLSLNKAICNLGCHNYGAGCAPFYIQTLLDVAIVFESKISKVDRPSRFQSISGPAISMLCHSALELSNFLRSPP